MGQDQDQPNPPAGTSADDFMRHPELSWTAITKLPVTRYRVQLSPNADFTNNQVALPNGGITIATQYDVPQTLPHASYYWRVRGEDAAGHATLWTGTQEGDDTSVWQFPKAWVDTPGNPLPATGSSAQGAFSWQPIPDASAYEVEISQNSGFPKNASSVETYDCTTNHTTFSPVKDYPLEPSPPPGQVEGSCDNFDQLMLVLQPGNTSPATNWYWRVRGIDGTTAAATPAETGVTCYSDGADCGPWTATQKIHYSPYPAYLDPAFNGDVPTGLTTGCTAVVGGGTVPLCYDTPTFSWNSVAGANSYLVETSADQKFTTDYHSYQVAYNKFTPRESFLDNQSGKSYYWRVRACTADFAASPPVCGDNTATLNFHKASPNLPLAPAGASSTLGHNGLFVTTDNNQVLSTAVKQVRGQQMTFHWDDLLQYTEQAGIQSNQEAARYRLEYNSTGDDWLSATTVDVDATHWTKQNGFLPDNGYYWRVAPIDGSDNVMSWSPVQTVVKGTIAPQVTIGETGLLSPTSSVNLTFAAPVTGVTSATLGLRRVGGGNIAGHLIWPAAGPANATFIPSSPLIPGERVMPWVTTASSDLAGNAAKVGASSSLVDPTIDSASPTITEAWAKISTSHASGGSYAKAAGVLDNIQFKFTGSAVSLVGIRTPDGGYGTVLVDGVPRKTINFYSHTTAYGVTLYSALLNEGAHTLTVQVKGSHPSGSKGNAVNVDTIKVDGALKQQTSAVQAWSRHRSTDAVKGSYDAEASYLAAWHASKPTLTGHFFGTAVHVVGCKSPDSGLLGVYIDGKLKATVDGYQSYSSCNKTLVHLIGLSSATHSIIVAPLGTHDSKATGTKVSVDAIVAS